MSAIIHHPSSLSHRRGIALLMVLLIVMAITIISAGFIAKTDAQFACGQNIDMRMQTDQLADSALEHARGLLLQPQDVATPYWTGGQLLQLAAGSPDYYDVGVSRDTSDPTDYCTYHVTCEAYRLREGEKAGSSRLWAKLRLDPCIALWTKTDTTFRQNWVLHGDLCTQGNVINQAPAASLDSDVFANQLSPAGAVGRTYPLANLTSILAWPPVTETYVNPNYLPTVPVAGTLSGSYSPARVWQCNGDLVLAANTTIQGMLLVKGNLTVAGTGCRITAAKNLPALYVKGSLLLESADNLRVEGLAVVDGNLQIRSSASNINFIGGLCLAGTIFETTPDASGNAKTGLIQGNPRWTAGQIDAALRLDGSDDYVDCGNDPSFDITNQITVAAWVEDRRLRQCRAQSVCRPKAIRRMPSSTPSGTGWSSSSTATRRLDPSLKWKRAQIVSSAAFNDAWHHVAGTFDGTTVNLYVDGVFRNSALTSGRSRRGPTIGCSSDPTAEWLDRFYQGAIDDVRIYDRALDCDGDRPDQGRRLRRKSRGPVASGRSRLACDHRGRAGQGRHRRLDRRRAAVLEPGRRCVLPEHRETVEQRVSSHRILKTRSFLQPERLRAGIVSFHAVWAIEPPKPFLSGYVTGSRAEAPGSASRTLAVG